jgi:uncharacterized protein YmfQ (DUF2313 family)
MTALDDRTHELQALLPDGPPWETEPGEDLYALLRSMAGEPVRIADAGDQHLADFMPDTCGDTGAYIPDWGRVLALPQAWESDAWDGYTDAQKQAVILAHLQNRADPNQPNLEAAFRALFDDLTILLTVGEHPTFLCGASGAGEGIGAHFQAVWSLRYMDHAMNATPDDFSTWDDTGTAVITPDVGGTVADRLAAGSPTEQITASIGGTADGDSLRFSVWVRAFGSDTPFTVTLRDRNGDPAGAQAITAKADLWQKIVILASAGTGAGSPLVDLTWEGTVDLAGAYAGVRAPALEYRAQQMTPLVTFGEFLVKGEAFSPPEP